MKKGLLVLSTLFLLSSFAFAQIKKGSIFLGGNVGGALEKTKAGGVTSNEQKGLNISPVFGKAIRENLVAGVNAGFNIFNNEYPADIAESKAKSYNAGIFLRKYKNIGASGFYIFAQGGLAGSYYRLKQKGFFYQHNGNVKRYMIGLNFYPGISYAVTRKLHLETGFNNLLSINYYHEKAERGMPVTVSKTNGFNITSSLENGSSLYLGFRVLIGK